MTTQEKIAALKSYVSENYETRGFDWIAECWGTSEMTEFVDQNPKATIDQLKRKLKKIAKSYAEREQEVRAEIW